jgi:hypothetical protein
MNSGALSFDEPFDYHPHVTLAQGVSREDLPAIYETAVRRWAEAAPDSRVTIDTVTFVQNTADNIWIDIEDCELRGLAVL